MKRCAMRVGAIVLLLVTAALPLAAAEAVPASEIMAPLDLREVSLSGEIGRRIDLVVQKNLLALDVEGTFLTPLRDRNVSEGYIGIGKLIDATVRFAVYSQDPAVLALKQKLVAETIKTQEADGYIGLLVPSSRVWGVYDIHEMSHIVLGLANDYRYFGEKASLEAARKLADFIIDRWSAEPDRYPGGGSRGGMYGVTTGLDAALLTLFEQTRDPRYLDFLCNFKQYRLPQWNAAIQIGLDHMADERHCYIYMALCVAQMQLNRIQPDPKLFAQAHRAIDFLTRQDGLLVSGSCSLREGWHSDQCGAPDASESCATAYLTRMLDRLLRAEGDSRYGDMMERAIYNALFAALAPDGRRLRYYCPLDGKRSYFGRDTYCCPNNFRRIMAELPMMVYYRRDGGLAVNLYTTSTAKIELGDGLSLTVRQETDYPNSGKIRLQLDPSRPAPFPLRLRIPGWCAEPVSAAVNGKILDGAIPKGSFLTISREWRAGDQIELELPMAWRLIQGRKQQAGRVAVLRGPVLYCLNPIRNVALGEVDLGQITLDPTSLQEPVTDATIRPDGLACPVRAWSPGRNTSEAPDLNLVLTEFVDPDGQAVFLRTPPSNLATEDELMR